MILSVLALLLAQAPAPAPGTLEVVQLPAGNVAGITVGYSRQKAELVLPNPKTKGFAGIVFQGQGRDVSTIHLNDWGASVFIGDGCGRVEFRDVTVVAAKDMGIKYGTERGEWRLEPDGSQTWVEKRKTLYPDSVLALRSVRLVTDQPARPPPTSTKWVVHSVNVDHDWRDVVVDAPFAAEHALYAHGFANLGIFWARVDIDAIGAEGLKVATRPWEAHFVPNARVIVVRSRFREWFQPWSWRGGAGATFQGSGAQLIVFRECVFWSRPPTATDAPRNAALRFDDGLSTIQPIENNLQRYYSLDGTPGGSGPANGHVLLERCAFQGYGGPELIRAGTIFPNYQSIGIPDHAILASFTMRECAAYGPGWKNYPNVIRVREVEGDQVRVRGSNTSGLRAFCEAMGFDGTDEEATVDTDAGGGKLSKNVSPPG